MKSAPKSSLYRQLPSVDELVHHTELARVTTEHGHSAVTDAARTVLQSLRSEITTGRIHNEDMPAAMAGLAAAVKRQIQVQISPSLTTVINATGVILHTNLGRAPLSSSAFEHMQQIACSYSNLELDLATGERGKRDVHVDRLFSRLLRSHGTGARLSAEPSTIVVNNNAAAVLLALNTLAEGGEVIASRGELVEIGGSFRIPDVMSKSSAVLREVGTTNRTRISDYERAINDKTRVILRVHRSNFEITGFTEQPGLEELVALARRRKIPLLHDQGSGVFFNIRSLGVNEEPAVLDSLTAGVDIVMYSGDKLLGGPQAGMLSGRNDLVASMRSNPLFRALRADKLTYAALEMTLLAYIQQDYDAIPVLRMMRLSKNEIGERAQTLCTRIQAAGCTANLVDGNSAIGGGAAPTATLPTRLLAVAAGDVTASELAARLRTSDPAILARVEQDRVLLDLRTVFPEQDALVAKVLLQLMSNDKLLSDPASTSC